MKDQVIVEDGVIAGNYYNKHETPNPVARYLVGGFYGALNELVARTGAKDIHEVGCGEGHLLKHIATSGRTVRASDVSSQVVAEAQALAKAQGLKVSFLVESIYDMQPETHGAELVICCEVMEHLEDPASALKVLSQLANPYLLVSVPREPVWRVLNMVRGKYWSDLGNTPGHLQHWSKRAYLNTLARYVDIVEVRSPMPWTMALCKARP